MKALRMAAQFRPFLLLLSIFCLLDSHPAWAGDDALTSNTTVAIIHSREIKYGSIRYPDELLKFFKITDETSRTAKRREMESMALRWMLRDVIKKDFIEQHQLAPTDAECKALVADAFKKTYGHDTFTAADAEAINKKQEAKVKLLELRLSDEKAADAMREKEYASTIGPKEWESFKRFYKTPQRVESLKKGQTPVSVESVYAQLMKNAAALLNVEKLIAALVKSGEIKNAQEMPVWLERKILSETKLLRPEFDLHRKSSELFPTMHDPKNRVYLAPPEPGKARP